MEITKEAFAEQVKEMLLHIYDLAYAPPPESAQLLVGAGGVTWQERTQRLRQVLIQAIERLDPGPRLPLRARERRSYAILSACYSRSMTAQAVMEELAISERQYWRDRKRAIEALVDQLWQDYGLRPSEGRAPVSEREAVAREEADMMVSQASPEEVSLEEVVRQAATALQRASGCERVDLHLSGDGPGPLVFADRAILRQICLNLLSHAFHLSSAHEVRVDIVEREATVEMSLSTAGARSPEPGDLALKIVRRLLEASNGELRLAEGEGWSATAVLPRPQSLPVLVVDDNAAIIKLFQRYLAGSRYRVIGAESGPKALELLGQVRPAAITLDVMMPAQDGWDTLQALRARPDLQQVPVIVCSILDEPQLAYSLGADDFIRKPVKQATLLGALNRWTGRPYGDPRRPAGPAGI